MGGLGPEMVLRRGVHVVLIATSKAPESLSVQHSMLNEMARPELLGDVES